MTNATNDATGEGQSSGFGLIAALMFILLVAAVMTPLATVSRSEVLASSYSTRRTAFELLAPGLSRVAYTAYSASPMTIEWQRCEARNKAFYLRIQDQNGLIDLNSASNPLLQMGFQSLGQADVDAAHFATRVEAYREFGGGGEDASRDPTFVAKHAPFENLVELYDVLAPSVPEIDRLAAIFTIYNKTDAVTVAHSNGLLREQLRRQENSQQFTVPGELSSGYVEISFAEFRRGEPFGFLSKIMMARSTEPGTPPTILQRDITFADLDILGLERRNPMPCPAFLRRMIESL